MSGQVTVNYSNRVKYGQTCETVVGNNKVDIAGKVGGLAVHRAHAPLNGAMSLALTEGHWKMQYPDGQGHIACLQPHAMTEPVLHHLGYLQGFKEGCEGAKGRGVLGS